MDISKTFPTFIVFKLINPNTIMKSNKVTIKITGFNTEAFSAPKEYQIKLATLRTAKEIGDIETINHTQLGKLENSGIKFDII